MVSFRFSAGKVWINYIVAVIGGIVIVVILGSLWNAAAFAGGIGGVIGVAVMLVLGAIRRGARREPILVVDEGGLEIGLPGLGRIPWARVHSAEVRGVPWVTGQRLVAEYAGRAPKIGFMDRLNWGVHAKQRGPRVRLTLGFLDQTDQSISGLKAALSRRLAARAA